MNIISTTVTRRAEERNEHALYHIDYTLSDGALERIVAAVHKPVTVLSAGEAPVFIGNISCENGQIYCSLPESADIALLMADFEGFVDEIKADIAQENSAR